MTSIVKTYSVPLEKVSIIEEFERIVRKDGSKLGVHNSSQMIVKMIEDLVRKHQNNPGPMLDLFIADTSFRAMPTLGENPEKYSHIKDDVKGWASVRSQALKWAQHAESELRKAMATETLEAKMRKETTSSLQRIAEQGGPENRVIAAAILKERAASNS